jgi:hypothetical protein
MPPYMLLMGLLAHFQITMTQQRFLVLTISVLLQRSDYITTTVTTHKLQHILNYFACFRLQLPHHPLTMCQQETP